MDAWRLEELARGLGADKTKVSGGNVQVSCLLAPWTHSKGRDSRPSMVLFPGREGPAMYFCHACHDQGTVRDLVLLLVSRRGLHLLDWVEFVDKEDAVAPTVEERLDRLEYVGMNAPARKVTVTQSTAQAVEVVARKPLMGSDGKPWYDYRCVYEADQYPEIEWEQYAPYAGKVPGYAVLPPPKGRGLRLVTCKAWELGDDTQMKRLLFPLRDRNGKLVSISGRLYEEEKCVRCGVALTVMVAGELKVKRSCTKEELDEAETAPSCPKCGRAEPPKYMHSKGFRKALFLYGEHMIDRSLPVGIVVEGHLDVLLPWQMGYRNVLAVLGSTPGEGQVEKLVAMFDEVWGLGDGDAAGRSLNAKLEQMIAGRIRFRAKPLPEKMDPGKMAAEAPEGLREVLGPPPCGMSPMAVGGRI